MRIKKLLTKHNLTWFFALLLIVTLAIGGSLAYLSSETDKLENEFSFVDSDGNGDLRVDIDEPNWEDDAEMTPGDVVAKDPLLINSSVKDLDEWVALTVVIRKGQNGQGAALTAAEAELFETYFNIDFEVNGETPGTAGNATWMKLGNIAVSGAGQTKYEGVYMYNKLVPSDYKGTGDGRNVTVPLFTRVSYKADADNTVADKVKNEWGGFAIILKGYAVQGSHVDWADLPSIWAAQIN